MKQNQNYITKDELLSALETFSDKIGKQISTLETSLEKRLEIKFDIKFEQMERRIDERARHYNSEILTKFDTFAREIENARIDRELTSDRLENHEKRIKKLEKN